MKNQTKFKHFRVENLFDSLNHEIKLNDGGVTIIHGPNGCGKTTLLKLLSATINCDLKTIRSTIFQNIELGISDDKIIRIEKTSQKKDDNKIINTTIENNEITIKLIINGATSKSVTLKPTTSSRTQETIKKNLAGSAAIPAILEKWITFSGTAKFTGAEAAKIFDDYDQSLPTWFKKEIEHIDIGFINTQRLFDVSRITSDQGSDEKPNVRQFVEIYSDDIKSRINEALNTSAIISQRRERSFPERMLNKQYGDAISASQISDEYTKLQSRFIKLSETGLQEAIPLITLPSTKLNPTERRVLSLYLEDLNEKLNVFSELQDQIDAFKQIIARKFRRKVMNINRKKGFAILDNNNQPLAPSALSSGEQHQIVMFYDLIFSKNNNLLFLIDEPEISLHVEWQRQFLTDLEKISILKGHQFLIATHSPQIIGSRRDLTIALDGGITIDNPSQQIEGKTTVKEE